MPGDDRSALLQFAAVYPQGSVLGPIEFISHTKDVVELFDRHGLSYHLIADDTGIGVRAGPVLEQKVWGAKAGLAQQGQSTNFLMA